MSTLEGNKVFETIQALDNKQAKDSMSGEINAEHARAINLIIDKLETSVSGGTVVLEGAPYSNYPETWIQLASLTVTNGKGLQNVNVNENDDGMPMPIVRVRISGAIANGHVDAYVCLQG